MQVVDVDFMIHKAKCDGCLCPNEEPHSHVSCPYLHPSEQARRNPLTFRYDSIFCYDLHNNKVCKRGVNCPYSHNMYEYYLHPSRYRTRMCEFGARCNRGMCFFAHSDAELRPRTAIKAHSHSRRSGRRPTSAARAAGSDSDQQGHSSSSLAGVTFLQVPSLPGSNSSSANPLPVLASAQEAFSRLSLEAAAAQQDPAQQQQGTPLAGGVQQPAQFMLLQDNWRAGSSAAQGLSSPLNSQPDGPLGAQPTISTQVASCSWQGCIMPCTVGLSVLDMLPATPAGLQPQQPVLALSCMQDGMQDGAHAGYSGCVLTTPAAGQAMHPGVLTPAGAQHMGAFPADVSTMGLPVYSTNWNTGCAGAGADDWLPAAQDNSSSGDSSGCMVLAAGGMHGTYAARPMQPLQLLLPVPSFLSGNVQQVVPDGMLAGALGQPTVVSVMPSFTQQQL